MKIEIRHHPGRHCASTALCNLANFHGLRWSEAACFGLGAGLGFWLIAIPAVSPSRFIHVRTADLAEQFFQRIGCPSAGRTYTDPAEGERELCRMLDKGSPVIALTDIYHLPYYRSRTRFPGHAITVWGYSGREKIFYVTDTEREEVLKVSFEQMHRARFCQGLLLDFAGKLYYAERLAEPEGMPGVFREAILANSRVMLQDADDVQGLAALARWGETITDWHELPDWQWAARFCYQVIERRGTGGGGYRLMYAEFLREAARYLPAAGAAALPAKMEEAGLAWRDLAFSLKAASERKEPDFSEAAARIARVYRLEAAYHRLALELV